MLHFGIQKVFKIILLLTLAEAIVFDDGAPQLIPSADGVFAAAHAIDSLYNGQKSLIDLAAGGSASPQIAMTPVALNPALVITLPEPRFLHTIFFMEAEFAGLDQSSYVGVIMTFGNSTTWSSNPVCASSGSSGYFGSGVFHCMFFGTVFGVGRGFDHSAVYPWAVAEVRGYSQQGDLTNFIAVSCPVLEDNNFVLNQFHNNPRTNSLGRGAGSVWFDRYGLQDPTRNSWTNANVFSSCLRCGANGGGNYIMYQMAGFVQFELFLYIGHDDYADYGDLAGQQNIDIRVGAPTASLATISTYPSCGIVPADASVSQSYGIEFLCQIEGEAAFLYKPDGSDIDVCTFLPIVSCQCWRATLTTPLQSLAYTMNTLELLQIAIYQRAVAFFDTTDMVAGTCDFYENDCGTQTFTLSGPDFVTLDPINQVINVEPQLEDYGVFSLNFTVIAGDGTISHGEEFTITVIQPAVVVVVDPSAPLAPPLIPQSELAFLPKVLQSNSAVINETSSFALESLLLLRDQIDSINLDYDIEQEFLYLSFDPDTFEFSVNGTLIPESLIGQAVSIPFTVVEGGVGYSFEVTLFIIEATTIVVTTPMEEGIDCELALGNMTKDANGDYISTGIEDDIILELCVQNTTENLTWAPPTSELTPEEELRAAQQSKDRENYPERFNLSWVNFEYDWILNTTQKFNGFSIDLVRDELPWPVPYEIDFTERGEAIIEFSKPVQLPNVEDYHIWLQKMNLKHNWMNCYILNKNLGEYTWGDPIVLNQTNVDELKSDMEWRRLQEVADLEDVPLDDFGRNKNFNWTIQEFTEEGMILQVFFEDYKQISFKQKDRFFVNFTNPKEYMKSQENNEPTLAGFTIDMKVPRQMGRAEEGFVNSAKNGLAAVMSVVGITSLVMSTMQGAGLQDLFGQIKNLQLTVHVPLFGVQLSSALSTLYEALTTVVMFDFLEMIEEFTGQQYRLMKYTPLNSFSDEFDDVGYGSTQTLDNLGSVKFMFIYFFFLGIIVFLIRQFLKRHQQKSKIRKYMRKLLKKVDLVHGALAFQMQAFFEFCVILLMYLKQAIDKDFVISVFEMEKRYAGDMLCLVTSLFLTLESFVFLIAVVAFFIWYFPSYLKIQVAKSFLKTKTYLRKTYISALGETKINCDFQSVLLRVDELSLKRKSRQMLVKRTKTFMTEEVPTPIRPRVVGRIQKAGKVNPISALKTSWSYRMTRLHQYSNTPLTLKQFYFHLFNSVEAGVISWETFDEATRLNPIKIAKTLSWKDGENPLVEDDKEEFSWDKNLPKKSNIFANLEEIASRPELQEITIGRVNKLSQDGQGLIEHDGRKINIEDIKKMKKALTKSKLFWVMKGFYDDINICRFGGQFTIPVDMLRRFWIAWLAVFCFGRMNFQLMVFTWFSFLNLCLITTIKPFKKESTNNIEAIMEAKMYVVTFLIGISQQFDLLENKQVYNMIECTGWIVFALEVGLIAGAVLFTIYKGVKGYKKDLQKWKHKKAWKKYNKYLVKNQDLVTERRRQAREKAKALIDFEDLSGREERKMDELFYDDETPELKPKKSKIVFAKNALPPIRSKITGTSKRLPILNDPNSPLSGIHPFNDEYKRPGLNLQKHISQSTYLPNKEINWYARDNLFESPRAVRDPPKKFRKQDKFQNISEW